MYMRNCLLSVMGKIIVNLNRLPHRVKALNMGSYINKLNGLNFLQNKENELLTD